MCSLKHSKTTPLDSHCTSPRHSQPQLPKQWSIPHITGLSRKPFPRETEIQKISAKFFFFCTLKCTSKLFFLFLSPPSPTTAQTGNDENQPFKYEPFSSDTSKQVFSFMDANLQESFPSSIQRTQDQDRCNVHSPDVTKPQRRETTSLKIPLQGLQADP